MGGSMRSGAGVVPSNDPDEEDQLQQRIGTENDLASKKDVRKQNIFWKTLDECNQATKPSPCLKFAPVLLDHDRTVASTDATKRTIPRADTAKSMIPKIISESFAEEKIPFKLECAFVLAVLHGGGTWYKTFRLNRAFREKTREDLFKKMDEYIHQDDQISFAEFNSFCVGKAEYVRSLPEPFRGLKHEDVRRRAFEVFDKDGSGSFDKAEFDRYFYYVEREYIKYLTRRAHLSTTAFWGRGPPFIRAESAGEDGLSMLRALVSSFGGEAADAGHPRGPRRQLEPAQQPPPGGPRGPRDYRRPSPERSGLGASATPPHARHLRGARRQPEPARQPPLASRDYRRPSPEQPGLLARASALVRQYVHICPEDEDICPSGLWSDFYYFSSNNHPLQGIFLCDPFHPFDWRERVMIELSTCFFSFLVLTLLITHVLADFMEAAGVTFVSFQLFSLIFSTLPSIAWYYILYYLYTAPCATIDDSQASVEETNKNQKIRKITETIGHTLVILSVILPVVCFLLAPDLKLSEALHELETAGLFVTTMKTVVSGRIKAYLLSWFMMLLRQFNTLVALGDPNPLAEKTLLSRLVDLVAVGQWRIEHMRFKALCEHGLQELERN